MKLMKIIAVSTLVVTMAGVLSGCGTNAEKLPLESPLTMQEVIDYYAQSISYDTIATRNIAARTPLEFRDATADEKKDMTDVYNRVVAQLKADTYVQGSLMSREQQQQFKGVIDDLVLSSGKIESVKYASGCFFIKAKYSIAPAATGTFSGTASYLGIHGALIPDGNGGAMLDQAYMNQANVAVNKYLADKAAKPYVVIDTEANSNTTVNENTATSGGSVDVSGASIKTDDKVNKLAYRKSSIDNTLYNEAAGSSKTNTAFVPENIATVYNMVPQGGELSGYGIFPQGAFGMAEFGYERSKMRGEIEITYVISQDTLNSNKYTFWGLYVNNFKNEAVLSQFKEKSATVSDFVTGEIEKVIDRVDRTICNNDTAGLMSKNIYEDMGMGISNALYMNNSNVDRLMSKLVSVKAVNGNYYMVGVERTVEDSSGDTTDTAVYKDRYYQVYKQDGYEFKLADYILVSRECIREPQPDNQSEVLKMLASLNLRGEISKETKSEIGQLFKKYYTAGTNRDLDSLNSCYSNDTDVLSSNEKEYLSEKIRGLLKKYGTGTSAKYSGKVKEWMGGSANQAELVITETIEYSGGHEPVVMDVYYLMYKNDTGWKIAEYKVLTSTEK